MTLCLLKQLYLVFLLSHAFIGIIIMKKFFLLQLVFMIFTLVLIQRWWSPELLVTNSACVHQTIQMGFNMLSYIAAHTTTGSMTTSQAPPALLSLLIKLPHFLVNILWGHSFNINFFDIHWGWSGKFSFYCFACIQAVTSFYRKRLKQKYMF
mgnify:CR=1 FL=1